MDTEIDFNICRFNEGMLIIKVYKYRQVQIKKNEENIRNFNEDLRYTKILAS